MNDDLEIFYPTNKIRVAEDPLRQSPAFMIKSKSQLIKPLNKGTQREYDSDGYVIQEGDSNEMSNIQEEMERL